MKKIIAFFIIVGCLLACGTSDTTKTAKEADTEKMEKVSNTAPTTSSSTQEMAQLLKEIYNNGDPEELYHWNKRLASLYQSRLLNADQQGAKKMQVWFQYCTQLLNAGENIACIEEINALLKQQNTTFENLISEQALPVAELLALAHLRLGEVENCRANHNEYSCIVPLKQEAFHKNKAGSEMAVSLYTKILDKFPEDKYKWLLNVAYMTLGQYPDGVPKKYLLPFPNWKMEQKNFKPFKEVALNLGIARNGLSGGVCFDDFNNDGYIDIFTTSYGMLDQCKLFLNNGKQYIDATEKAGLTGIVSGLNCLHADYNNDGFKDILILRGAWLGKGGKHPNSLLKNNGDGTFSDVTKAAGIFSLKPTQSAAWADVNKDGYLDLFVGNEANKEEAHTAELFINQKNGTFKEQASAFGLGNIIGFTKGVSFGDINKDGWPDLYVSMLGSKNLLFKNQEGKFVNISAKAKVQEPITSFPCWFWDVNNDGYDDIFVSSYDIRNLQNVAGDYAKELQAKAVVSDKSKLFINNGDETFAEQSAAYGVDISLYAMGANFGDLDNDGWLDFYVGTGAPNFNSIVPNRMFRNIQGKKFEEVTSAGRFGHIQKGHGIGFADMDNDGDQDIYAVMGGAFEGDEFTNVCFENPNNTNNWVIFELYGVETNKSAVGTKLQLQLSNGRNIYHTVGTGGSFGASSLQAEIGIGKADAVQQLVVNWQNGEAQTFTNIAANVKYKLTEGSQQLEKLNYTKITFEKSERVEHHH